MGFQSFRCHGPPEIMGGSPMLKFIRQLYKFKDPFNIVENYFTNVNYFNQEFRMKEQVFVNNNQEAYASTCYL